MKVLLVEDDHNIRRMLIRLLRRMFVEVDPWAAESVDQAIDFLRVTTLDVPFDLVISDFNLVGEGTGGDVLEWIQNYATHLEPRFVFLTSDRRASELHYNFIEKPCDVPALRAAIETVINNARS